MRTLLMELRPAALSEADPGELLKHLADAFTGRTGLPVYFDLQAPVMCEIPADVKLVFYRIAQEGLNNILKHAQATRVWMHFRCDMEMMALMLRDDGLGFSSDHLLAGHLGLGIMKERAESIGAELSFSSQPGDGTTLHLVWNFKRNTLE
jgi:signal transduction histidine kinase